MLNIFRQRQTLVKAVFGVILFLVVVSMAVTLIPGITGDTGDSTSNPVVADVGGEKITSYEVQQSLQQVSQRNRFPSEMMPFYATQVLNEMVLEKASLREAERLGLRVDESELLVQLRRDPTLYPSGSFVGQQQYEDIVSERFGMNVAQFEQRYRESLLLEKLRQFVTDSIAVTPEEVHAAFVRDNEKVVMDYVLLFPADFKKDVSAPGDAALQDYYKKYKDRYQIPDRRSAKILLVEREKVRQALTLSDADLKKYYQDHLDSYRVPERVAVSHILLKADPKDAAKMAEARKKAEGLLKKLKGGADFAALAKENSDDTVSAKNGGFLNWVTRKQTVPEFEQAAFSLAPGTLSDPVQTVYGIHILKVMSHDQPHLQPFEEVKPVIQATQSGEQVNKLLAEDADKAAAALATSPGDIAAIAEKYHAEVLSPPPFAQSDTLPRIGTSEAMMQETFGLKKGQAGSPVQVSEGYAIPVLLDILPAHQGDWAEVKDKVKDDLIMDQAAEKVLAKAKELGKVVEQQGKKDLKKAAQTLKLTVKTSPAVGRDGTIPPLGPVKDLDPKIFTLPVGGTDGPVAMGGGQVVYQIASHDPPKEEDFAARKTQIQEQLLGQKRQLAFDVFQDSLKRGLIASGRLKIHQDALAQLTGAAGSKR